MATLREFNSSLETTRSWVADLMEEMNTADEARACRAFRAVVQQLRDHLPVDEVADFSAQLPLLLRGVFFEGWKPAGKPVKQRDKAGFLAGVARYFSETAGESEIEGLVQDVFRFLARRVSLGEIRDVVGGLPKELRELWPERVDRVRRPAASRG